MTLHISDITELDSSAQLRSDVQVSFFRKAINFDLLKSFMFSSASYSEKLSSAELLKRLRNAAVDNVESRFLIQATYGRGKSHFALAVANYFGKPGDSPEVKTLLQKLEHSHIDKGSLEAFRSFKRNSKPYLVLLLRGDTPRALNDQFFRELDEAIRLTPETEGITTPFWFSEALKFLDSLTPADLVKANAYLLQYNLDVPALQRQVSDRVAASYQTCINLVKELTGITPDFGSHKGMDEAIGWVIDELCEKQARIGGLLILFDEFSEFVRSYSDLHPSGLPLQQLLNGVDNKRGRVLFVGFAQHEPEQVTTGMSSQAKDSLAKELNRLPLSNRFWLHSTLEDIFSAYFKTRQGGWQQFIGVPGIDHELRDAGNVAFTVFSKRYQNIRWTPDTFQSLVTNKCFPLHPLTTALLSGIEFEAAANTRSVLGFLTDDDGPLKTKLGESAIVNGRPNWVYPIALVDYFQDMLGVEAWQQYCQTDQPDLTPDQKAILKAMLLHKIAGIESKSVGYLILMSHLSGLNRTQAESALRNLESAQYIRYDSLNGTYSFWTGNNTAVQLEKLLNQELDHLRKQGSWPQYIDSFNDSGQNKVNQLFVGKDSLVEPFSVKVSWGHPDDWAAPIVIITRASWKPTVVEKLSARYSTRIGEPPECRGLVFLLLAENQEDLIWLQSNAQSEFDKSLRMRRSPTMFIIPDRPTPELISSLVKYSLVNDDTGPFYVKAVQQVGIPEVGGAKGRLRAANRQALNDLIQSGKVYLPLEARSIPTDGVGSIASRIEKLLEDIFQIAYHIHPGQFFTQYKLTTASLRSGVQDVIAVLIENGMGGAFKGLAKLPADLVSNFLASSTWGLLSASMQIQIPKSSAPGLRKAWERLDSSIQAGRDWAPLKEVLLELLNAPYGYDHNTLALLFSAWVGFNRRDLELAREGRITSLDQLGPGKGKYKPVEFIEAWAGLVARRKDHSKTIRTLQSHLEAVDTGGLDSAIAANIRASLAARLQDLDYINSDPSLADNIQIALKKLSEGLETLRKYDEEVDLIVETLAKTKSLQEALKLLKRVRGLSSPTLVVSRKKSPPELREQVNITIAALTERICVDNQHLSDIKHFSKQEDALKLALADLSRDGMDELATQVKLALKKLQESAEDLETQQRSQASEAEILGRIAGMQEELGGVSILQNYLSELEGITGSSERVRSAIENKRSAIKRALATLLNRIPVWQSELLKEINPRVLDNLHEQIIRGLAKYEGTETHQLLDALSKRYQTVAKILRQVGNPPEFADRNSFEKWIANLQKLKMDPALEEPHRAVIDEEARKAVDLLARRENEASQWLANCERQIKEGVQLEELEVRLNTPHIFLKESELGKLGELKDLLKKQLEADARKRIEHLFKRLSPSERQHCLAQLVVLLQVESS